MPITPGLPRRTPLGRMTDEELSGELKRAEGALAASRGRHPNYAAAARGTRDQVLAEKRRRLLSVVGMSLPQLVDAARGGGQRYNERIELRAALEEKIEPILADETLPPEALLYARRAKEAIHGAFRALNERSEAAAREKRTWNMLVQRGQEWRYNEYYPRGT